MTVVLTRWFAFAFFLAAGSSSAYSQDQKWPDSVSQRPVVLPIADPLITNNGSKVTTARQWAKRRKEILRLFATEEYGQSPSRPKKMTFKVFETDEHTLNDKATRKQVTVFFNGRPDGPQMDILIYLPHSVRGPVPLILQLGFGGNYTLSDDPAVRMTSTWVASGKGVIDHRATEACRGKGPNKDVELILSRGYGFATIYCGDIAPDDKDSSKDGVLRLYPGLQDRPDNFSTIGAWAWGLSRALDYMETDRDIDARKVAVFGFSRLGKAAVWAGATDKRFAMVISNESGAGGVKLFHSGRGETIKHLCTAFPHWFCTRFRHYIDQDTLLPFDQHMVIAMIAPRPICIGSAENDKNSDPEGEYYGAVYAGPVYRLLGTTGLEGQIQYHMRPGSHGITTYDWMQYLSAMDKFFKVK